MAFSFGAAADDVLQSFGATDAGSLVELLRAWEIPAGREQAVHDMAFASLEQVKGSTEYDDARSLLTIVAFLTALAGAVFTRFSSTYDLPRWRDIAHNWDCLWAALTYAMFGTYAVIVCGSAFVIFGAMKPTFFRPAKNGYDSIRRAPATFHHWLLETHPRQWGQSFVELTGNAASGADRLTAEYAKRYILESYLVAQKIALKLKRAAPAVKWLQLSMLFLAGFIVSYGATLFFLAPSR